MQSIVVEGVRQWYIVQLQGVECLPLLLHGTHVSVACVVILPAMPQACAAGSAVCWWDICIVDHSLNAKVLEWS